MQLSTVGLVILFVPSTLTARVGRQGESLAVENTHNVARWLVGWFALCLGMRLHAADCCISG